MLNIQNPDLYHLFRAGVVAHAAAVYERGEAEYTIEQWATVPKEHTGRQMTSALILNFFRRMAKEFPGGAVYRSKKLTLSKELVDFLVTHGEMKSSEQEAVSAWAAMQTVE